MEVGDGRETIMESMLDDCRGEGLELPLPVTADFSRFTFITRTYLPYTASGLPGRKAMLFLFPENRRSLAYGTANTYLP